jgi:hypothetical protein
MAVKTRKMMKDFGKTDKKRGVPILSSFELQAAT